MTFPIAFCFMNVFMFLFFCISRLNFRIRLSIWLLHFIGILTRIALSLWINLVRNDGGSTHPRAGFAGFSAQDLPISNEIHSEMLELFKKLLNDVAWTFSVLCTHCF